MIFFVKYFITNHNRLIKYLMFLLFFLDFDVVVVVVIIIIIIYIHRFILLYIKKMIILQISVVKRVACVFGWRVRWELLIYLFLLNSLLLRSRKLSKVEIGAPAVGKTDFIKSRQVPTQIDMKKPTRFKNDWERRHLILSRVRQNKEF